jgi:hypothetical protein
MTSENRSHDEKRTKKSLRRAVSFFYRLVFDRLIRSLFIDIVLISVRETRG